MKKSIGVITKKGRGRPVTTGKGTLIGVRLLDGPLSVLDAWMAKQNEPDLTRPEAIRRLVEIGLATKAKPRQPAPARTARAKELAAGVIDRLTPATADVEEKASRKQRLLKGPEEFREMRVDRPRAKGK
jgi:hypothetical protein